LYGIDTALIPGYSDQGPINFEDWYSRIFGGGGGGGGGSPQSNPANEFLNSLFGGGISEVGELNPDFINNIYGLQNQAGYNYDALNTELSGLERSYNSQISGVGNNLLSYLLSQGDASSNSPSGRYSFSGGGGISTQGIEGILASLPEFQAREIRTDLPELSPELARELDVIKQSQLADFESLRSDQNSELLTRLFGSGVQQSTVAGEAAARANEGLERTRLAVLSEDINRRLGLRSDEAGRILQGDLGSLSAEEAAYGDRLRALTGIRTSELGAQASAAASSASAGASAAGARAALEGDRLRALASIYGSQVGGLQSLFGSQVGGLTSGFGTQQGTISNFADLFGNLALGDQQADIGRVLGLGEIAGGVLGTQAQERIAGRQLSAQTQANQLGFLDWMNDVQGRFQSGLMGQTGFDLQRELAQLQADVSRSNAAKGAGAVPGTDWGQLVGTLALAYASYQSDLRLKTDVHEYDGPSLSPDQVLELTPYFYRYIDDVEVLSAGVIAQDLEKIIPELVIDREGYRTIRYDILTAMLLKGYRDLVLDRGDQ
jgi:hypothetical protein